MWEHNSSILLKCRVQEGKHVQWVKKQVKEKIVKANLNAELTLSTLLDKREPLQVPKQEKDTIRPV